MRLYTKIFIVILLLLIVMHYRKYKSKADGYEIQQQELDYTNGSELYNQLNPLIITFIEETSLKDNVQKYELHSPLSISKDYSMYNPTKDYLSHNGEILMIRSKETQNIELINPKFSDFFDHKKSDDVIFKHHKLPEKNNQKVQAIDVVLREYNILFIPRHWLFKFSLDNKSVESKILLSPSLNFFTTLFLSSWLISL